MHADDITIALADEAATDALGSKLARAIDSAMVVWLHGDLGAGKTALVRAMLRARGVTGPVKSPTYSLVEVHEVSGIYFYHFDFYRFNQAEEYLDAGLDEYFSGNGVCLVEWPDKAQPYLANADVHIHLSIEDAGRRARLRAASKRGQKCLNILRRELTDGTSCALQPPA